MDTQESFESEMKALKEQIISETGKAEPQWGGGACYIQRGTFRTCFSETSVEQCELIARQSHSSVYAYVPGQACGIQLPAGIEMKAPQ